MLGIPLPCLLLIDCTLLSFLVLFILSLGIIDFFLPFYFVGNNLLGVLDNVDQLVLPASGPDIDLSSLENCTIQFECFPISFSLATSTNAMP